MFFAMQGSYAFDDKKAQLIKCLIEVQFDSTSRVFDRSILWHWTLFNSETYGKPKQKIQPDPESC